MKLRLLFFLLINISAYCQKPDLQIEYQTLSSVNMSTQINATLYIHNNISIYKVKYAPEGQEELSVKNQSAELTEVPDDDFLKIDHTKKEVLFFDDIMRHKFLVKDNYNDFNWQISGETKNIAGINSIKATTSFRGREWVAWFTPEISVSMGPWKLHGLPGLILEAYDTQKNFIISAVKIEHKINPVFDKDFSKLFITKNKAPITYQEFIEDKKEASENLSAELNKKLGGRAIITTNVIPRTGKELRYDWEK